MKIGYAIALCSIPLLAVASGHGDPPPSSKVTTIEDVKNVLFYFAIAMAIVASVLTYLNHSLRQAMKRRTKSSANLARVMSGNNAASADESSNAALDVHLEKVRFEIQAARDALQEEVDKVQGRSSLNLAIGIVISVAAIWILASHLGDPPPQNVSWEGLFATYFPRFIACIFIELLAFFFLRLYRAGIVEMRTYGADLKELTLKQVAIETVWNQENAVSPRSKFALALLQQEPRKVVAEKADPEIDPQKAFEVIQKLTSAFVEKSKAKSDKKDAE